MRHHAGPPQCLLDPAFPYGEDLLQFIWEQGLYERHALRTTDGREVEVVEPGRIQHDSGPDLADARVRIGGQLWAGTVEVHLRSSEWDAHGHQRDPAYENVVLHVVYEHDAEARTAGGRVLPTVELLPRVPLARIGLHHDLMRGRGFVPCAGRLADADPQRTGAWLERVLVERLERKAQGAAALLHELGADADGMAYHLVARGLGQPVNAEPFGMLARALPLRILRRYRDDALRTEALLFGQAGLLQASLHDAYPRALQREHGLLARMHGLRPGPLAAWKLARMRPASLPAVRIAQLGALIRRCEGSPGMLLEHDDPAPLRSLLAVEADGYWADHYVFDRPSPPRPKRLGRAAADRLIINAVVPALFALARAQGRPALAERALRLLERLPAEGNAVLRGWAAAGIAAGDAGRGQALLELREAWCRPRRCLSCGIGRQLLRAAR